MPEKEVPHIVISRLPIYLRALTSCIEEDREIISSQELGEMLGISPAQIRKDLSHFGEFGKQGTGYDVKYLREQLRRILKVDREWEMALVGAGDLGRAIVLHYERFEEQGFHIVAVFDKDPRKIGEKLDRFEILDSKLMPKIIKEKGIRIAIIAVPASEAQKVADTLVKAGVKGFLNYAPVTIHVPPGVRVQYIDPVVHLQRITYYL